MILTSLWCPHWDHLVGLVQLAETLSEHLDMVSGVWFQHGQFVGGLVAVSVHNGPLLSAYEPEDKRHNFSHIRAPSRLCSFRIIFFAGLKR